MFNPNSFRDKQPLNVAPVHCRLELIEEGAGIPIILNGRSRGDTTPSTGYDFAVNPETVELDSTAEVKKLAVLGTPQPLVAYQSSETVLSFPVVKFWTPNNSYDLTEALAMLESWTRPIKDTFQLPRLRLKYGTLVYEPLYLTRFRRTIIQMRDGKPTQADGDLQFAFAPDMPANQDAPDGTKLSDRERQTYSQQLNELRRRGQLATPDNSTIEVSERGVVEAVVNGVRTRLGTIWSLLGSAVRPGRTEESTNATEPPTAATANQRGV